MNDHEHDACPYMFHSSLRLYAMVHKPIDVPSVTSGTNYRGDMQMICHRTNHERFICTYLSPLDAAMGSRSLRDDDAHFWPIDFRRVDTRHFMDPYFIRAADGRTMQGRLDSSGTLPRVFTDSMDDYHVYWGDDALAMAARSKRQRIL